MGGSDRTSLFSHLPESTRTRLNERAQALMAIPTDGRVTFMVRELEKLWAAGGRRGIERVDPSWIVHQLRGETPRLVGSILLNLPQAAVRSVLKRLPTAVRQALPPKHELRAVPQEVQRGIALFFAQRFAPMPERASSPMRCVDIVHLGRRELQLLVRDLGLTELGQAFVAVGKMALVELCRRLPAEAQAELIEAVRAAAQGGAVPEVRSAQRFLSRVVVNFEDTEEFLAKAGLWRLAKAMHIEDAAAQRALAQRLVRRAGKWLTAYIDKVAEMDDTTPEACQALQDAILARVVLLSRGGRLAPTWATTAMFWHDTHASTLALA